MTRGCCPRAPLDAILIVLPPEFFRALAGILRHARDRIEVHRCLGTSAGLISLLRLTPWSYPRPTATPSRGAKGLPSAKPSSSGLLPKGGSSCAKGRRRLAECRGAGSPKCGSALTKGAAATTKGRGRAKGRAGCSECRGARSSKGAGRAGGAETKATCGFSPEGSGPKCRSGRCSKCWGWSCAEGWGRGSKCGGWCAERRLRLLLHVQWAGR